jgi:glycosyltransferase involved in cell wall biosynthesis
MKKIKILFMLPQAQQGGAETQTLNLLRGLNKKKFEVYLGMLYENEQLKEEFESIKGVQAIYFNKKGPGDFLVFSKIMRLVKEKNIDIIQTFLANHYSYVPALFCRRTVAIGGIRSTIQPKEMSFVHRIITFSLPKIISGKKKLVLISNSYAGKELFTELGFKPYAVRVIPNGIDFQKFKKGNKNRILKELKLENKFVLGTVSRLTDVKNHEELLYLLKDLNKSYHNLVLLIVGDGPLMSILKDLTKSLNLHNVIFTGNRKDIPDILKAMDLFLFPSRSESWPNVVGEAMAAGVPVVVRDVGDVKHIVRHNYNGVIAESNSQSFKKEVIKLMNNKNKMKRLGLCGQNTIFEQFQIKSMVGNYEKLFISIYNDKR